MDLYIADPTEGPNGIIGGFSITSSPLHRDYIDLAIKRIPEGRASVHLHDRAEVGDPVMIDGGYGEFYYREGMGNRLVLIAGGIGITPLISMIRFVDEAQLADLNFLPGGEMMEERPFFNPAFNPGDPATFDFVNRVSVLVAILQASGLWALPHPWFNAFLPTHEAFSFIADLFATLIPSALRPGSVVIIYPFNGDKFHAPLMRVPTGDTFFSLALLRTATDPASIEAAIVANAQLRDDIVALGGKRYPIDSVPMTKQDWLERFQPEWGQFNSAKQRFDPDHIMTPGQGIF